VSGFPGKIGSVVLLTAFLFGAFLVAQPAAAQGDYYSLPLLPSTGISMAVGRNVNGTNGQLTAVDAQFKLFSSNVTQSGIVSVAGIPAPQVVADLGGTRVEVPSPDPFGPVDGFVEVHVPTPDPIDPCCTIKAPLRTVGSSFALSPDVDVKFEGSVFVVVSYVESAVLRLGAKEADVRLLHFTGGGWVDATASIDEMRGDPCCDFTSNPETTRNAVVGRISSFSALAVVVADTTPPLLAAPAGVTAECSAPGGARGVALGAPFVLDNFGTTSPFVLPTTNDAPDLFPLGTTTVHWITRDASGNLALDTQSVSVRDTTPPTISIVAGTIKVSDLCDASLTVTNDAPGLLPPGHTSITWTVTDSSGNSASAAQTIRTLSSQPAVLGEFGGLIGAIAIGLAVAALAIALRRKKTDV